jgi:hypothetical protein
MNEVTLAKNEGFAAIVGIIDRLILALIDLDLPTLVAGQGFGEKLAAE